MPAGAPCVGAPSPCNLTFLFSHTAFISLFSLCPWKGPSALLRTKSDINIRINIAHTWPTEPLAPCHAPALGFLVQSCNGGSVLALSWRTPSDQGVLSSLAQGFGLSPSLLQSDSDVTRSTFLYLPLSLSLFFCDPGSLSPPSFNLDSRTCCLARCQPCMLL